MDVKIFLMFIVAENTRSVNIDKCSYTVILKESHTHSDGIIVHRKEKPKVMTSFCLAVLCGLLSSIAIGL